MIKDLFTDKCKNFLDGIDPLKLSELMNEKNKNQTIPVDIARQILRNKWLNEETTDLELAKKQLLNIEYELII